MGSAPRPVPRPGSSPAVPGRRRRQVGALAVVVPFVLVGAARASQFAEDDTFWETRTGDDVLRQHTITLSDTYSCGRSRG